LIDNKKARRYRIASKAVIVISCTIFLFTFFLMMHFSVENTYLWILYGIILIVVCLAVDLLYIALRAKADEFAGWKPDEF
tara:strand:- start:819 stop:1058 length:240 start_codon:yes stop_codon:yes gene_type:complete